MKFCRNIWGYLFPVSEPADTRIPDPFFAQIVQMYASRARLWLNISYVYLILTALFVVVCILIFLKGDPQEKQLAESEVLLTTQLADLRRELGETSTREADELAQSRFVERANVLANRLGQFSATIENYQRGPNKAEADKVRTFVVLASSVLKNIDPNANEHDVIIDMASWNPQDSNRFPVKSLAILREEIRIAPIDIDTLKREVSELRAHLDAVETANFDADSDAMKKVSSINKQNDAIRKLKAVSESLKAQYSQAAQAFARWQESAPVREEKRQAIQNNIDQIEEDLKEVRAEREKILFMAWVPDLTVRVGAVVLLLFLTQIFVATYRYTVALSAFYLARADAVRLLQPSPDKPDSYGISDFGTLADKLSPTSSVDSVKGPIEQVTDLVKAWIGKVKGS